MNAFKVRDECRIVRRVGHVAVKNYRFVSIYLFAFRVKDYVFGFGCVYH